MKEAGFSQIEVFGNFDFHPYDFEHPENNRRQVFVACV